MTFLKYWKGLELNSSFKNQTGISTVAMVFVRIGK